MNSLCSNPLTHHPTGPVQKAAQAAEFRRWSSNFSIGALAVNTRIVGSALALIASIAGIGSFALDLFSKPESKPEGAPAPQIGAVSQSSIGSNSPNIANVQGNITVNIQSGKSKLDFPNFDFSLQPFPGWRRDSKLGEKFNSTIASYIDKTVYLSVTLSEEMTKELDSKPDEYGRFIFTVRDDIDEEGSGGAEYLVHLSKADKNPFEIRDNVAVLSGYFKIYDINGPRQGFMSVNLRPVKVD